MLQFHRYLPVSLSFLMLLIFMNAISADAQIPYPDPGRFEGEINRFKQWDSKNSFNDDGILFVGSSSIRLWSTAQDFPQFYVINRGFGGSHISDVLYYYETVVKKYHPSKIVFYAGDNDIAAGKTAEQVFNDYKEFISKVETDLPGCAVYFLSIKPSGSRWSFWPEMSRSNSMIEQFCQEKPDLYFVDTASPMLDGKGKPESGLFIEDELHLNKKGYQLWTEILVKYLGEK